MALSPSQTRKLLGSLNHLPNKKLGQNFLIDGNIARKSIELAELGVGAQVVEIGPGLGALTQTLLEAGAKVWAVERDATLIRHLSETVAKDSADLTLTEGDCLDYPTGGLEPEADFIVVANLPYAVSTPWMDRLLRGALPQRMVLMLQKEAANRYNADPGSRDFSAISIFLQSAYSVTARHPVAANCFYPAPKVESVLLRLDLKADPVRFSPQAHDCVRRIFTQRRKQLGALCRRDPQAKALTWFQSLLEQGVSPTVRPEELALEHWQKLTNHIAPR